MVTDKIITNTFRINYKGQVGTCFAITIDNEKYLITARHIIEKIKGSDIVQFYRHGNWEDHSVNLIGHTSPLVDISVLTADLDFSSSAPLQASLHGLTYSQDVYFLGFPNVVDINQTSSLGMGINRGFPIPIVKHAIFSGTKSDNHFFIDGYENKGFSGGPLVFKPRDREYYQVAGVITKSPPEIIPVYKTDLQANNDGGLGSEIVGYFRGKSGIITVSSIQQAIVLIEKNKA